MREQVAAALGAEGAVARAHPGFTPREGQLELALAIAEAIETHGALIAEAGTGTGKTFAYLVPALLAGGRVMIATGTRTLQDQLHERDLPEVRAALGVDVRVALLKGRANYVCHYHLARNLADGRFARREDVATLQRIRLFAEISPTGDRAAAPGVPEDSPVWAMATSTRENCLGQECPEQGRCFVFKARQAAQQADIVIVNHHLFCADLALRDEGVSELLPTTNALIFDEAHQLPDVATQFFGRALSSRQLVEFARDCLRAGLAEARDAGDWSTLAQALEQSVRELRLALGAPGRRDRDALARCEGLVPALERCAAAIAALGAVLEPAAPRGREVGRCAVRAAETTSRLAEWRAQLDEQASADGVIWSEASQVGFTLHCTPLSVAEPFRRHRDARPCAWIFLSATLSVGADLGHFARSLGFEDAEQRLWQSPFDYAHQALLWVPDGLGDPASADFPRRLVDAVWPALVANGGRAFVLCTTLRAVDRVSALLAERMRSEAPEMTLLVQGSAARGELLERFRAARSPVLVGSASFWEGVDVPGQQLSLVVIDKLPFAPPDDPILRARVEAMRRAGGDPFRELQLPEAAMALKQGAGRLIRSERDRGLLVVCDERLATRAYGRLLVRSLPPFRRTRSADEAIGFVREAA